MQIVKTFLFVILLFHGIVVNIIFAIVILFIQHYFTVYEYALVWFLSNQINAVLFHLYNNWFSNDQILSIANKIGVIDSLLIYKKLFYPIRNSKIDGKLFFSITMHIAYFGFYLFLSISIINVFVEVYPLSSSQNILVFSISALMYFLINSFNKSLVVQNKG